MDGTRIVHYLVVSQMVFKSLQGFPLVSADYFLALVMMLFFRKKRVPRYRSKVAVSQSPYA